MILSGHPHRDRRDRHGRTAADRLSDRLADIDARRRVAERSIDALLASWQGGAALHQQSGWHDWDLAAHDVIDSLSALIGALDLAREELTDARAQVAVPHQADRRAGPGAVRIPDLDRRTGGELTPGHRPRSGS